MVRSAPLLVALASTGCFVDPVPGDVTEGTGAATTSGASSSSSGATSGPEGSTGGPGSSGSSSSGPVECPPGTPTQSWYVDGDADGWGAGEPIVTCTPPDGYVTQAGDCDDTLAQSNPGEIEVCDGLDNDCDALLDEYSAMNEKCDACALAEIGGSPFWGCAAAGIDWPTARAACMAFGPGVDLASVRSADEALNFAKLLQLASVPTSTESTVWIGLRRPDEFLDVCGGDASWVWSDGAAFEYMNWGAGQPDNHPTTDPCNPDCMSSGMLDMDCPRENCGDLLGDGGWNDAPCYVGAQGYICRASGGQSTLK